MRTLRVGLVLVATWMATIATAQGTGEVTEFRIPVEEAPDVTCFSATGLVSTSNALWFPQYCRRTLAFGDEPHSRVGRLTTGGAFSFMPFLLQNGLPDLFAIGPDAAVWWSGRLLTVSPASPQGWAIGRLSSTGLVDRVFPEHSWPRSLVSGPDGALWYTSTADDVPGSGARNIIGRMNVTGSSTEFPVPGVDAPPDIKGPFGCLPGSITAGPDGALWFTEACTNFGVDSNSSAHALGSSISRITTGGTITRHVVKIPTDDPSQWTGHREIVAGPDGALWTTLTVGAPNFSGSRSGLARMTTGGGYTQHLFPDVFCQETAGAIATSRQVANIVVGPDGALWFTENVPIPRASDGICSTHELRVGRFDLASAALTELTLPGDHGSTPPQHMIVGPDGAFWINMSTSLLRFNPPGLHVQVEALSATGATGSPLRVPATSLITARVIVKNTSAAATPPARLTLTEGEGAVYAHRGETDSGTFGTVEGKQNVVYFDIGAFAAGEQKTFEVPLIVAPALDEENPVAGTVRADFTTSAPGVFGQTKTLEVVGTPITEVQETSIFASLLARPVADMGTDPDGELGAPLPASEHLVTAVFPSDLGDMWEGELTRIMKTWPKKDQSAFSALTRARFSRRAAYAAIYIRGLMSLVPTGKCIPDPKTMAVASWKFFLALQASKWFGTGDTPFLTVFATTARGLGAGCGALYPLNVMEFLEKYSSPLVEVMRDGGRTLQLDYTAFVTNVCNYLLEDRAITAVPHARLVETDLDYRLARGTYHPILHNNLLAQVLIRDGKGGHITLGAALDEIVKTPELCQVPSFGDRRSKVVAIQAHSPVMPVVTDVQGRRSGADPVVNAVYDEIPGTVFSPGHPWKITVPAIFGPFQVKWMTAYASEYGIDVEGISSGTVTSSQSYTGTATNGFAATQTIAVTIDGDKVLVNSSPLARSSTALGDFDGDGKSDILWRAVSGAASGAMFVWRMNGTTLASGTYLDPISTEWVIQGTGDFNGDGRSDVLWRNMIATSPDAGKLYVWLMDGPKVIAGTGYTSAQADFEWAVQGIGDFDADGKSDIVWRAVSGAARGAMFLWRMNGATLAAGTYLDPISTEWQIQRIGDLTGDGKADILWRNMAASSGDAGKLYLWVMNGTAVGAGTGYTNSQADFGWAVQGIGDLDGDGKNDIVWRATSGPSAGAMFLWLMNGATIKGATFLDPISTDWQVQGLADLSGDGKADVLWRNVNPNVPDAAKLYVWIMDGAKVVAGTGYTSAHADATWDVKNPR